MIHNNRNHRRVKMKEQMIAEIEQKMLGHLDNAQQVLSYENTLQLQEEVAPYILPDEDEAAASG